MKESLASETSTFRFACIVLASLLSATPMCFGQKLVLLGHEARTRQLPLETAARFYGLQVQSIRVRSGSEATLALDEIRKSNVRGVVATADSLSSFSKSSLLSALRRGQGRSISLLITDFKPENCDLLKEWSDGALTGFTRLSDTYAKLYEVGSDSLVTREISNEILPLVSQPDYGFRIEAGRESIPLLLVRRGDALIPVFARTEGAAQSVFFLVEGRSATRPESAASDVVSTFSSVAPFMMFVRYAAGDFGWHSPKRLANFTIDDPWLTEPYGYLSYRALLREMEKHNFHTTIAFVPWNFDRSQPEVAALFRDRNDRFSIAIHGNNHDHQEFDEYTIVPLADQVADIKQALARMERFSTLTGASYDRVMVFPHSIAPQETLAQLKKYGFRATVNSDDVPKGTSHPTDANFYLRSYSSDFADFPSIKRFSAEVPLPRIVVAVNAFLENPLLFYGHAVMFHEGIEVFNGTADTVNAIAPATDWSSLGYVADHLYLVRSRTDGAVDVRMFGNRLVLENPTDNEKVYWVRKPDNAQPPIKSLVVDGEEQNFERVGAEISFSIAIPAQSSRQIQVQYVNDLELAQIPTTDPTLRLTFVRKASDFRDIVLPKYRWGKWITSFYYRHQMDSLESDMELRWFGMALIAGLAAFFVPLVKWCRKLRTSRSVANPAGASK